MACWPMPQLAVPFPAGQASGSGRFRCRLSSRQLPQCPRAPAATAALRRGHGRGSPEQGGMAVAGGRPSMHAPQWTPTAAYGVYAGSRTSTRAAVPTTVSAARRAAAPADTVAVSTVRPELRPPGDAVRTAAVHRGHRSRGRCPAGAGTGHRGSVRCWAAASGTAAGVRMASVHRGPCPRPAGVRGYRKRSPARRPLEGCRHRR
jgi:hypothetical protein